MSPTGTHDRDLIGATAPPARGSEPLRVALLDWIRGLDSWSSYQKLLRRQWDPPEVIRASQDDRLRGLLRAAAEVPAYRQALAKWKNRLDRLDPRVVLRELPVLTRPDVRARGAAMLTLDERERRSAHPKSTGGSTGEPLRYFISASAQSAQWAQIWRGWNVAGFHPGSPVGIVAGRSLLAGEGLRRRIYGHLQNWVSLDAFEMSEETMAEFARALRRHRTRFLYGYASALESFAAWLAAAGERPSVEAVFTTAEQLLPQTRSVIENGTGGVVYDAYGANDGGVFGFECERHEGLHLGSERCLIEIVRADGSPARVGEVGRVVSSDLENLAFPFLRYDVGDLAALDVEPCPCGRGLPRLQKLSGRSTDVLRLPDRRMVHGEVFSHYFKKEATITRFQAIQKSSGSVEVRIRPLQRMADGALEKMQRDLAGLLPGLRVFLTITDEFERSPAGKCPLVIPLRGSGAPAQEPSPVGASATGGGR